MTRRKFTSAFKTKVVLEALKERESLAELAQKYDIHPQQIGNWKREFLKGAENVFSSGEKNKKTEAEEKEERPPLRKLLRIIGQQKVELDRPATRFLKKALS